MINNQYNTYTTNHIDIYPSSLTESNVGNSYVKKQRAIYGMPSPKRLYPLISNVSSNNELPDYLKLPKIDRSINEQISIRNKRCERKKLFLDQMNFNIVGHLSLGYNGFDTNNGIGGRKRYIPNPYVEAKEYQPIKILNTNEIETAHQRKYGMRHYDIISNEPNSNQYIYNNKIVPEKHYFRNYEKYDLHLGRETNDARRILNKFTRLNPLPKRYIEQLKQSVNHKFINC